MPPGAWGLVQDGPIVFRLTRNSDRGGWRKNLLREICVVCRLDLPCSRFSIALNLWVQLSRYSRQLIEPENQSMRAYISFYKVDPTYSRVGETVWRVPEQVRRSVMKGCLYAIALFQFRTACRNN